MKALILADAGSVHTIKWINSLVSRNVEIILYSLNVYHEKDYVKSPLLTIYARNLTDSKNTYDRGILRKIIYLKALPQLKGIVKKHNPDFVHAHYASSYGILGALSGVHPFVLSVWGSDVFLFPKKNNLFRAILKYNLKKADLVLSTSEVMARETSKYTNKDIKITPFGVNTEVFYKTQDKSIESNDITIGTIKKLDYIYGVDLLIKAFAIVIKRNSNLKMNLVIAGIGNEIDNLKVLAKTEGVSSSTDFLGKIDQEKVVECLNDFDIYVALSRSESFGVAIIEAMACGTPVVVSDVGGLPEVVQNNVSGMVVKSESIDAAVEAIQELIDNKSLREKYSKNGRIRVKEKYDWEKNVDLMLENYSDLLK